MHEQIDKLTKSHDEQMGCLRKSVNRTAIFTFIAGAVIGVVSNIAVTAWMG
ncbi:hypothetical protein WEI85_45990 [Actinomycetes bacterium KLBMP 9797]